MKWTRTKNISLMWKFVQCNQSVPSIYRLITLAQNLVIIYSVKSVGLEWWMRFAFNNVIGFATSVYTNVITVV